MSEKSDWHRFIRTTSILQALLPNGEIIAAFAAKVAASVARGSVAGSPISARDALAARSAKGISDENAGVSEKNPPIGVIFAVGETIFLSIGGAHLAKCVSHLTNDVPHLTKKMTDLTKETTDLTNDASDLTNEAAVLTKSKTKAPASVANATAFMAKVLVCDAFYTVSGAKAPDSPSRPPA